MKVKQRTLDDFLKEVVIDCWNGLRYEAGIRLECRRLGSSADGSVNYRLEATYNIKPADGEPVEPFIDNFSLDSGDEPEDFVPYAKNFLEQYGIPSKSTNGILEAGVWALRQKTLAPHIIARMLDVAEIEVNKYYRRTHGAEVRGQTMLNCRDVMAIARKNRFTDEQTLEKIRKFYK